jgi:hypothetical protein
MDKLFVSLPLLVLYILIDSEDGVSTLLRKMSKISTGLYGVTLQNARLLADISVTSGTIFSASGRSVILPFTILSHKVTYPSNDPNNFT